MKQLMKGELPCIRVHHFCFLFVVAKDIAIATWRNGLSRAETDHGWEPRATLRKGMARKGK